MRLIALPILAMAILGSSLLATACAAGSAPSAPPGAAPQAKAPSQASSAQDSAGTTSGTADRMVVRSASLQMVVANVDETLSQIADLAKEVGGYVVSSESQELYGDRVGKASLRVPAARLDESVKRLKGMATRVGRESGSSKDVTEEFVDQEARLRTLRATESQYLELMKSARSTDDILKVQQSLGQVREQIERAEGRIQYLRGNTEMALISLDLTTPSTARPLEGEGWSALETLYGAVQGLISTAAVLASMAIWVVVFSPVWLPTVLLVRWWRRRGRRGGIPPIPPPATAGGTPA